MDRQIFLIFVTSRFHYFRWHLDRELVSCLDVRSRNRSTAGGLGRGFCFEYRWLVLDRDDRLHVQSRELTVSTWAVAIPRLVAILATLSRLGMGFHRRGLPAWTLLAWLVLPVCFFFMPPPNPEPGLTPVNINYVWGLSDYSAQNWVSPAIWLAGLMIGLPLVLFVPTHFLLSRFAPKPHARKNEIVPFNQARNAQ